MDLLLPLDVTALLILFAMAFVGNGLIPLPITAYVLWLGQYHFPVSVVVVGTSGSILGWILLHKYLIKLLDKKPHLAQKIPENYHQLFLKKPALTVFLFNALPFAWDPTRVLATMNRYDPSRLTAAIGLGRLIRYSLMVSIGMLLADYKYLFIAVFVMFLALPLVWNRLFFRLSR